MAKFTISKNDAFSKPEAQVVYIDRIIKEQHTVEVPVNVYVDRVEEKTIYVDRPVEIIKEVPVERIVYEQKEVLVHVPQPCEIIRIKIEEKIIKILPVWAKMLMAAQAAIIVLIMVIK